MDFHGSENQHFVLKVSTSPNKCNYISKDIFGAEKKRMHNFIEKTHLKLFNMMGGHLL